MIKSIEIAQKIQECRNTLKTLHGEKFADEIEWYKNIILAANVKHNTKTLESVVILLQLESTEENPIIQMHFLAAAAEILEPSN